MHPIQCCALARFDVELDRVIGDSQVSTRTLSIGVVELDAGDGRVGTGFFHSVTHPLPSLPELCARFAREVVPDVVGEMPACWINRMERPRGGRIRTSVFAPGVEQAMWDLHAQAAGISLARLLGARRDRVPAYASGLEFHLDDDAVTGFYTRARERGFDAFKVKVGHPAVQRDIHRLQLVRGAVGPDAALMADANEAWSPKEAVRRLHAFRDAGFRLSWIEDPCLRDDHDGLRTISRAVPDVLVNAGEYLDLTGKRELLEHGAVDVLNVHGSINDALRAAWLAGEHGIPVSVGNTNFEIGVHVAAALPELAGMEYSFLSYDHLVAQPIEFRDGHALVPDRPGHGLRLSDDARQHLATVT